MGALRTFFRAVYDIASIYSNLSPLPVQNQTRKFGCRGGGGHLSQVQRLWGWSVCPPFIRSVFLLPLQISCSPVVAKLMCNSCAPFPPPTRLREIKKRAIGCCRARPMLFGWGECKSTNYRGTCAQCFLRCGLDCFFQHFFLQILRPPPPPLIWALLFFNFELTQTCIAIDVHSFPPPGK